MFDALKRKFFGNGRSSRSLAHSRLSFVLVQDRTGLTNEEMAKFRKELIGVIENYFVIDKQAFEINYRREADTTTLLINSPVLVRRQDTPNGKVGAGNARGNGNRKVRRRRGGNRVANATPA